MRVPQERNRLGIGAMQNVRELGQIVVGTISGRKDEKEITLFKSMGIASEDIATAARVYELAKERGLGREVAMWQSI